MKIRKLRIVLEKFLSGKMSCCLSDQELGAKLKSPASCKNWAWYWKVKIDKFIGQTA